ncbi:hypothetical protein [Streptomyces sp. NPDC016845]|uniref:hypothetical protein n=1 Tax=Streptomyces sp. NPDC016845 TaxID=3364972 RepID=UPI0037B07D5C
MQRTTRTTRRRPTPRRLVAAALLALTAATSFGTTATATPQATATTAADGSGQAASVRHGKPVSATPGQDYVYPSAIITNTGSTPLGSDKLVITADDRTHFLSDELGISRRDGQEEHLTCDLVSHDRVLVCDHLDLNLDPRRNLVVYPEMAVDSTAGAPGTAKVTFDLGSPTYASGTTPIDLHT